MLHRRRIFSLVSLVLQIAHSLASTFNVLDYGAKPGGTTDSSKAFLAAWAAACSSPDLSKVHVPRQSFLLANTVTFSGQGCTNKNITVQIDGTLVATDYTAMGNRPNWIIFQDVHWVTLYGGTLDGRGKSLWDCKLAGKYCPDGASTLAFYNSQNIVVNNLHSVNSKLFHVVFNGCQNVYAHEIYISNPGNSQNTDGIHVQMSSYVTIFDANIGTGDDCISIGPGAVNLWIEKVICGPGHGISIGSLGKDFKEPGVRNVTVKNATISGTQNGVRIKSWSRKSRGFANRVVFQNITMDNVQNPIIIDQNYCPEKKNCPHEGSGVKIVGVTFQHIHGTSAEKTALTLNCSNVQPCRKILLDDINLTYDNQPAESQCSYASVRSHGTVIPNCNRHSVDQQLI